ncbi:MAG TPA: cytochrome P450, partial [Halioglobus sp.]
PAVPKPDHIPDALVYDFDFHADPGIMVNPHDHALKLVREAPPIFWTPRNGGHWVLKSHQAVFDGSREIGIFSSAPMPIEDVRRINANLPDRKKIFIPAPISFDPPHHAVYRGPLQSAFSPKVMAAIKDDIRALAVELIEAIKPEGRCEFMRAVAEPLPVTIFLRLFGLPVERQRQYRDLVRDFFSATSKDPLSMHNRLREVADIMNDTILERRDNPQDDVISMLWQSEFEGQPATLYDIENYCVMLFVAGLDTVMSGMGLGVCHLARDQALQARLRANPGQIPTAAEELMRRYTFTLPPRYIAADSEFQGVQFKKGEQVLLFLPAADLDPVAYEHAEQFDMDREGKPHIAFGVGPHRCVGSHLARIELNIMYEELLARLPEFRLDPDKPPTYHGGNVWGPEALHLVWDA